MNTEPVIPTEPSGAFIDVDTYRKLDAECELLKAELRLREAEIRQLHVTVCGLIINEKHPIEFNKTATHYFQIFPCLPQQSSQRTVRAPSAAAPTQPVWPPMDFPRVEDILLPPVGSFGLDLNSLSTYLETVTGKIDALKSQTASPNATPPPESTSS